METSVMLLLPAWLFFHFLSLEHSVSNLNEQQAEERTARCRCVKSHLRAFSLLTLGGTKSSQNGWPNSRSLTVKLSLIHMFLKETCKTCFIYLFFT